MLDGNAPLSLRAGDSSHRITDWVDKGGGPGTVPINLFAGANPFVFDYYQGPCCGAFIQFEPGTGVTFQPPPPVSSVPEPGSLLLTALGTMGVAVVARKRRRFVV